MIPSDMGCLTNIGQGLNPNTQLEGETVHKILSLKYSVYYYFKLRFTRINILHSSSWVNRL